MLTLVPEAIERYAVAHTSPLPEIYERLRVETYAKTERPIMQVGPLEGRFLKTLAILTQARRVVEVGTFTGYSALSIAEGMVAGGHLVTCEIDPEVAAIAQRYFGEASWGDGIDLRLGSAVDTLTSLELDGPLDMAFLDADKENYVTYYEALVPRLRAGGVLVADNVLWSGRVLEPDSSSDHALAAFNAHVQQDPRVDVVMLTVRDGISLAVKRP